MVEKSVRFNHVAITVLLSAKDRSPVMKSKYGFVFFCFLFFYHLKALLQESFRPEITACYSPSVFIIS